MKWTIKTRLITASLFAVASLGILFGINKISTNVVEEGTAISIMRAEQITVARDLEHHTTLLTYTSVTERESLISKIL